MLRQTLSVPPALSAALGCLLLGALMGSSSEAQTLEEILESHYAARGGLEAIEAIDSWRMSGRVQAQGRSMPIEVLRKQPSQFRQQLTPGGSEMISAFDGETAWTVNPTLNDGKPIELQGALADSARHQSSVHGLLVNPAAQGVELELVGKTPLGSGEVHEIRATRPDGSQQTFYLDSETFLVVRVTANMDAGAGPVDVTVDFSDYREVAGVKVPARHATTSAMGAMVATFDEIEANVEIADEVFMMPGQVADAALSLEQILQKHREVRDFEALASVDTVVAKGNLGLMGLKLPLTLTLARPRSARLEADMAGSPLILAFDGEQAWALSALQGMPEPEALPPEASEAIAIFADFLWGLLDSAQKSGVELAFAGVEKVRRDEGYAISMTAEDGSERKVVLGGEDFLERQFSLRAVFMGAEQDIDALLGDYREVDGVQVPFEIELLSGGAPLATVSFEVVDTGLSVDPELFSLPEPEAPQN